MMRPYERETERTRELEVRAGLARAMRSRPAGTEPSRPARRPALALAGALRRAANRLDASGTSSAPSAPPRMATPC
jgi:hypothetical protein